VGWGKKGTIPITKRKGEEINEPPPKKKKGGVFLRRKRKKKILSKRGEGPQQGGKRKSTWAIGRGTTLPTQKKEETWGSTPRGVSPTNEKRMKSSYAAQRKQPRETG